MYLWIQLAWELKLLPRYLTIYYIKRDYVFVVAHVMSDNFYLLRNHLLHYCCSQKYQNSFFFFFGLIFCKLKI